MLQKLSTVILESQAAGSAVRLCESLLELDTTDLRSITFNNQLSSSSQLSLSIFKLCWFIDLTLEDKQTHAKFCMEMAVLVLFALHLSWWHALKASSWIGVPKLPKKRLALG